MCECVCVCACYVICTFGASICTTWVFPCMGVCGFCLKDEGLLEFLMKPTCSYDRTAGISIVNFMRLCFYALWMGLWNTFLLQQSYLSKYLPWLLLWKCVKVCFDLRAFVVVYQSTVVSTLFGASLAFNSQLQWNHGISFIPPSTIAVWSKMQPMSGCFRNKHCPIFKIRFPNSKSQNRNNPEFCSISNGKWSKSVPVLLRKRQRLPQKLQVHLKIAQIMWNWACTDDNTRQFFVLCLLNSSNMGKVVLYTCILSMFFSKNVILATFAVLDPIYTLKML